MEQGLGGKRVAVLAADGLTRAEAAEPRRALEVAGATVHIVSTGRGPVRVDDGDPMSVDCALDGCHAADYDGLVVLGGENASALAGEERALQLVREFMLVDKPVAVVGRGTEVLVAADAVAGRSISAGAELREAVTAAGGRWSESPVVVDERLITARAGTDLTHFTRAIVKEFANRIDERRVDQMSESSFPASDPPPGPSAIGGEGAARTIVDRSL